MSMKDAFEGVVAAVAATLQPYGFARQGLVLRRIVDNCALVSEFQKSDKSTRDQIIFTINVGLVRGELLDLGITALKNAQVIHSHLSMRLGRLLPDASDKWWELSGSTDQLKLSTEISNALITKAIPYFDKYLSANALIVLWESGKSPGLTAVQRARYLHRLKNEVIPD